MSDPQSAASSFPTKAGVFVPPWLPQKVAERKRIAAGELPAPKSATYSAGCHCGSISLDFTLSPPLDEGYVVVHCNCSMCRRTGNMLAYPLRADVTWTNGSHDRLGVYRFNTKNIDHLFCKLCGCSLGVDFQKTFGEAFDGYGINVRALNNVDLNALTYGPNDGVRNVPPAEDLSGKWYDHATGKLK